jgi:DNA-3-methyladenine glycosylase I
MGTPVYDDATLFEFLILETFQAGLSWITILNKGRISGKHSTISTIKKAFIQKTRSKPFFGRRIIRNKLKVRSAVSNAIAFMKSEEFGSFQNTSGHLKWNTYNQPPKTLQTATTPLSDTISTDLKSVVLSL